MEYFNVKVGKGNCGDTVGDLGRANKNKRDEIKVNFCEENEFVTA